MSSTTALVMSTASSRGCSISQYLTPMRICNAALLPFIIFLLIAANGNFSLHRVTARLVSCDIYSLLHCISGNANKNNF